MFSNLRKSIGTSFAKVVNIAALISILSSFFTFAPIVPVHAQEALQSLTTTLAQPIFSADWDTDTSLTNVSFTWKQYTAYEASAGDACIGQTEEFSCVKVLLSMQDTGVVADHDMQEWMSSVQASDFNLSSLPANASVASSSRVDFGNNSRFETLTVWIGCTAACVFATSTEYTLTIVNGPLKNQEEPAAYTPGEYSTTTARFYSVDQTAALQTDQSLYSVVAVGKGITVTANVNPTLSFQIQGREFGFFYSDPITVDNSLASDTCNFGLLVPNTPQVCAWNLYIATNASNGYAIYVVQDHNMEFNGNEILQFANGTRRDDTNPGAWSGLFTSLQPTTPAHLGYSSTDESAVNPGFNNPPVWAGIPDIASASGEPFEFESGLVADSPSPGDDMYTYAIKVESNSTLPQGTNYTHNEYFIVVGLF